MSANLVLMDGNVLTMNPSNPHAEAIAIKKDRIVEVGKNVAIRRWIGKETQIINLKQKTVVPGFIDTHIHVGDFARSLTWIDLKDVQSIPEMQRRIRERAMKVSSGGWILGRGWDKIHFVEDRSPNVHDLDEASPDKPVILYHRSKRVCVVNRKALEMAGVTKETTSPKNGAIEKDTETGELTGILRGKATDLVWQKIPEPDEEQIAQSARMACEKIIETGGTSVHWIVSSLAEIKTIQKLHEKGELPLRVNVIIPLNISVQIEYLGSCLDSGDNYLKMEGIKLFADGSLAERTAALKEPYSDKCNERGKLFYTQDEIKALVSEAYESNSHLVIHAMGDRAIDMVLTAFEKTWKEMPDKDHRYRIEHASVLNPQLIQRIKKLGIVVSIQPCTITSEFSVWSAVNRLGSKRARWLYPLKTLIREGIRVIGGSDCPMESINPLLGIKAAVARKFFPEERITVDEALRMYTVNAAYSSFEEDIKGTIEEGKLADLAILSDDPQALSPDEICDIQVEMTIVGGEIVHSNYPSGDNIRKK